MDFVDIAIAKKIGGGGSADIPVKDVLVNGTSVVDNNGNANISVPEQSGPLHVTWNTDDTPNTLSEYFQDISYAMEHSDVTIVKYEINGDDVTSKYFYVIEVDTEIRSENTAGIVKISNGTNVYTFETGNIEAYEPMELVTN